MWEGNGRAEVLQGWLRELAGREDLLTSWQLKQALKATRDMWATPRVTIQECTWMSQLSGRHELMVVANRQLRKGEYICAYVGRAGYFTEERPHL